MGYEALANYDFYSDLDTPDYGDDDEDPLAALERSILPKKLSNSNLHYSVPMICFGLVDLFPEPGISSRSDKEHFMGKRAWQECMVNKTL